MPDSDRLKELLAQVKQEVEQMDPRMKRQEPSPGVRYEDWVREEKACGTSRMT